MGSNPPTPIYLVTFIVIQSTSSHKKERLVVIEYEWQYVEDEEDLEFDNIFNIDPDSIEELYEPDEQHDNYSTTNQ